MMCGVQKAEQPSSVQEPLSPKGVEGGQVLEKAEVEGTAALEVKGKKTLSENSSGASLSGVNPFPCVGDTPEWMVYVTCELVVFQEFAALDEQVKDIQASLEKIDKKVGGEGEGEGGHEEGKEGRGSDSESDSEEDEEEEGKTKGLWPLWAAVMAGVLPSRGDVCQCPCPL